MILYCKDTPVLHPPGVIARTYDASIIVARGARTRGQQDGRLPRVSD